VTREEAGRDSNTKTLADVAQGTYVGLETTKNLDKGVNEPEE
jgi:hypothetical protein